MDYKIKAAAQSAYNSMTSMLEGVFSITKSAISESGVNFDVRVTMNRFDVLLQYSMMQVALHDNYLHVEELKLIRDLSHYCNFCDYLNQRGCENVTWQTILNTDERELKRIVDVAYDDMVALNNDLLTVLPIVDKVITDVDIIEEIKNYVIIILSAVAAADGDFNLEELKGCLIGAAVILMENKKKELINAEMVNEKASDTSKRSQKKSLKDFYVKKN